MHESAEDAERSRQLVLQEYQRLLDRIAEYREAGIPVSAALRGRLQKAQQQLEAARRPTQPPT